MKILIDGDILAYRAAYYCEDKDPEDGEHKIDDLVGHILKAMRQYLIEDYNAKVSEGQEADDDIAIRATELGPSTIIASIDKDFLQIPCSHYNFNRGTLVEVGEFEGLQFVKS